MAQLRVSALGPSRGVRSCVRQRRFAQGSHCSSRCCWCSSCRCARCRRRRRGDRHSDRQRQQRSRRRRPHALRLRRRLRPGLHQPLQEALPQRQPEDERLRQRRRRDRQAARRLRGRRHQPLRRRRRRDGRRLGLVQPLDVSRIENWDRMFPVFQKLPGVTSPTASTTWCPSTPGVTGIVYDTTKVPRSPTSFMELFDPKYKGQVAMIDYPVTAIQVGALALGYTDPIHLTDEQLDERQEPLHRGEEERPVPHLLQQRLRDRHPLPDR